VTCKGNTAQAAYGTARQRCFPLILHHDKRAATPQSGCPLHQTTFPTSRSEGDVISLRFRLISAISTAIVAPTEEAHRMRHHLKRRPRRPILPEVNAWPTGFRVRPQPPLHQHLTPLGQILITRLPLLAPHRHPEPTYLFLRLDRKSTDL